MKSYKDTQYIEDIYSLAKMEFSLKAVDEAARIIGMLHAPLVEWKLRRERDVLWLLLGFAVGLAIGEFL